MSNEEFREFVLSSISPNAQFDGSSFSLELSYDDYLLSYRSILKILQREVGDYEVSYDFNLKKAKFFQNT